VYLPADHGERTERVECYCVTPQRCAFRLERGVERNRRVIDTEQDSESGTAPLVCGKPHRLQTPPKSVGVLKMTKDLTEKR